MLFGLMGAGLMIAGIVSHHYDPQGKWHEWGVPLSFGLLVLGAYQLS